MKLLGKLNARSLMNGDVIEIYGVLQTIVTCSTNNNVVTIETDKCYPFILNALEKVKIYA